MPLKLFGSWASSYTQHVHLALRLKGLEFEYVEEDLGNKSDELLRHNPVHKKVPVLVHGGRALPESDIILQYLDDAWPETRPLLPADAFDRALARFWCHFADDKVRTPSSPVLLLGTHTRKCSCVCVCLYTVSSEEKMRCLSA